MFVPTVVTAPMMATAMRAAINAYSIAVTPDSSLRKLRTRSVGILLTFLGARRSQAAAKSFGLGTPAVHFSWAPISPNTVVMFVPTVVTAPMMATAMRAAINAYSIAVTPDSSLRKLRTRSIGILLTFLGARRSQAAAKSFGLGTAAVHFSWAPISPNTLVMFVPTVVTAPMMATAIRLAIRAYSIAVTPDSSLRKFLTRNMGFS